MPPAVLIPQLLCVFSSAACYVTETSWVRVSRQWDAHAKHVMDGPVHLHSLSKALRPPK